MKNRLFSKGLYIESLRQQRAIALLMCALTLIITTLTQGNYSAPYFYGFAPAVLQPLVFYMYIGPVMLAMRAFSYVFSRNSSDVYHALPDSRLCMYFSQFAAIATNVLATILLNAIAGYWAMAVSGYSVRAESVILGIASFGSASLLVTACVVLAICATGTRFSALALAATILFVPRFVLMLCAIEIQSVSQYLLLPQTMGILLNTGLNIPFGTVFNMSGFGMRMDYATIEEVFNSTAGIAYTIALAVIYTGIGALVFRKRKSETAELAAPSNLWRHVYRNMTMLPVAYALVMLTSNSIQGNLNAAIILLTLASVLVAGYLLYEFMLTRSFKGLLPALLTLPAIIALSCGLLWISDAYASSAMKYAPKADEIASIRLLNYDSNGFNFYSDITASETVITDAAVISDMSRALEESIGMHYGGSTVVVEFQLDNGSTFTRRMAGGSGAKAAAMSRIMANDQYMAALKAIPEDGEITRITSLNGNMLPQEKMRLIWDALKAEMASPGYHADGKTILDEALRVWGVRNRRGFADTYRFTEETPNAARTLIEIFNEHYRPECEKLMAALDSGGITGSFDIGALFTRNGEYHHFSAANPEALLAAVLDRYGEETSIDSYIQVRIYAYDVIGSSAITIFVQYDETLAGMFVEYDARPETTNPETAIQG